MLYLIVGPSGGGKTTLIRELVKKNEFISIMSVDVYSPNARRYEVGLGRNSISKEEFVFNKQNSKYDIVNSYGKSMYGYNIPKDVFKTDKFYFLDYPGDYPECEEFEGIDWFGIYVLPPNRFSLIIRLIRTFRFNRILSSIREYSECIEDLSRILYNKQWKVFISINYESLDKFVDYIIKQFR